MDQIFSSRLAVIRDNRSRDNEGRLYLSIFTVMGLCNQGVLILGPIFKASIFTVMGLCNLGVLILGPIFKASWGRGGGVVLLFSLKNSRSFCTAKASLK